MTGATRGDILDVAEDVLIIWGRFLKYGLNGIHGGFSWGAVGFGVMLGRAARDAVDRCVGINH